jgi:hypothetical protein
LEKQTSQNCFSISPLNFLIWTNDGQGLLYRNRELGNESGSTVWFRPLTGGVPKPFLSVKPDSVFYVSQSNDGKQTAVVSGNLLTDAVMLSKTEKD